MNANVHTRDDRIRDFGFELDQLLLELVLSNHPDWRKPDGSCPDCLPELQRLRADTDRVGLLDA